MEEYLDYYYRTVCDAEVHDAWVIVDFGHRNALAAAPEAVQTPFGQR